MAIKQSKMIRYTMPILVIWLLLLVVSSCKTEADPLEDWYGHWEGTRTLERYDTSGILQSENVENAQLRLYDDATGWLLFDNSLRIYRDTLYWGFLEERDKLLLSIRDSTNMGATNKFFEVSYDVNEIGPSNMVLQRSRGFSSSEVRFILRLSK